MRSKALLVSAATCAALLILFVVWQLDAAPSAPAQLGTPTPAAPPATAEEIVLTPLDPGRTAEGRDDVAPEPAAVADDAVGWIEVLVKDTQEGPIEGAAVHHEADGYETAVETDADGRARVALPLESRGTRLHVDAAGFHHATPWSKPGQLAQVVLRRLASVEGRVMAEDTSVGLAGAAVRLQGVDCGLCATPSATTDGNGGFRLLDVPLGGPSRVQAAAEGYVTGQRDFVLREEGARLELFLEPGRELWLEVVDFETGAAVEGARIERRKTGAAAHVPSSGRVRSTELIGLEEDEGMIRFSASADGYCVLEFFVDPRTAPEGEMISLRLPRAVTVRGRVHDGEGHPLRASVLVVRLGADDEVTPLDGLPEGWRYRGPSGFPHTNTDGGSFEIEGLLPWSRSSSFYVTAAGYGDHSEMLDLGPPGTIHEIDITLVPQVEGGGGIRGRLTLNGRGLMGEIGWRGPTTEGLGRTDGEGNFELTGVEPGRVSVTLDLREFRGRQDDCDALFGSEWPVEVREGEVAELDLALEMPVGRIAGRVLRTSDEPASGVTIRAQAEGGCARPQTVSDEQGRFELEVDARLFSYALSVHEGPEPQHFPGFAPGSEDVELRLSDITTLRYRVLDRDTQRPVVESRLLWRRPGESRYRTRSFGARGIADPEGWHEVAFAEGTYDLGISLARQDAGYLPAFVDGVVLGEEGGTLLFEVERGIELELSNGGEKRKQGKPNKKRWPKDVTVMLLDVEYLDDVSYKASKESWKWGPDLEGLNPLGSWKVVFDKLGVARVTTLRPGRHRFRSFPAGLRIHPSEIDVRPGMDPIEIRWSKAE